MSIKIHYKGFNLIVHNTDTRFGFGGNIEDNPVFKVDRKGRFWDVSAYTLPELQVKFERLVDEKIKMTEDKEVQLVNQFISDLNQVLDEMEVVEKNVYYEIVLEAKLMKIMKTYGDSLCLGSSINVYRSHYNYVVKQREKENYRVGEQSLIKRLNEIPPNLTAPELNSWLLEIHELFKDVLGYNLVHLKTKYFELIENK